MTQRTTPTPWSFVVNRPSNSLDLIGADGQRTTILAVLDHEPEVGIFGDPDGARADMTLICRAVNSHDALVKALEEIVETIPVNQGGTQGAIRKRALQALAPLSEQQNREAT
jgi:hypothetical protein